MVQYTLKLCLRAENTSFYLTGILQSLLGVDRRDDPKPPEDCGSRSVSPDAGRPADIRASQRGGDLRRDGRLQLSAAGKTLLTPYHFLWCPGVPFQTSFPDGFLPILLGEFTIPFS